MDKDQRSQQYYDEFSNNYEKHRSYGYHAMIDELESEIARPYCTGKKILEAGCGTGLVLSRLKPAAIQAIGIDISAGMLLRAKARDLSVVQSPIDTLPFPDNYFDTVVSFKVLAHIPNIKAALAELARVTRPGGHLILEFYNRYSLRTFIKKIKHPTQIGTTFNDEDVFTRFDSLNDVQSYLPPKLRMTEVRGIRVFTPTAKIHDLPLFANLLPRAERWAMNAPLFKRLGGFLVTILQKLESPLF